MRNTAPCGRGSVTRSWYLSGCYNPALVDSFFSRNTSTGSLFASTATSNQPIIISSQVWSPQRTSAFGIGIVPVVRRVVEVRGAIDARALGEHDGL